MSYDSKIGTIERAEFSKIEIGPKACISCGSPTDSALDKTCHPCSYLSLLAEDAADTHSDLVRLKRELDELQARIVHKNLHLAMDGEQLRLAQGKQRERQLRNGWRFE